MKNLSDSALVAELRGLVARERSLLTEVLQYLLEVEVRKLYLARGFSSLFAFCTEELGYSEPEAQLRIQSMRLLKAVPEVEAKLESGELSMSVAAQIQGAARREKLPKERVRGLVEELSGASKREAERVLASHFPGTARPEKLKPLAEDLVEIRFTVSREVVEEVNELLDRGAHVNFERSYEKLFARLVAQELDRQRKKEGVPSRQASVKPAADKSAEAIAPNASPQRPDKVIARHIPAEVRRKVFQRDGGCCQYQDPQTKKICGTTHGVQIDHILPFSHGGNHSLENLRLLCGAHNRERHQ